MKVFKLSFNKWIKTHNNKEFNFIIALDDLTANYLRIKGCSCPKIIKRNQGNLDTEVYLMGFIPNQHESLNSIVNLSPEMKLYLIHALINVNGNELIIKETA